MRICGFEKIDWINWNNHTKKLCNPDFTTFRLERRDKPLSVGEELQIVIKPRTKERIFLGVAEIISIERKEATFDIKDEEARADGFQRAWELEHWVRQSAHWSRYREPIYKITLRWKWWSREMIEYVCKYGRNF